MTDRGKYIELKRIEKLEDLNSKLDSLVCLNKYLNDNIKTDEDAMECLKELVSKVLSNISDTDTYNKSMKTLNNIINHKPTNTLEEIYHAHLILKIHAVDRLPEFIRMLYLSDEFISKFF